MCVSLCQFICTCNKQTHSRNWIHCIMRELFFFAIWEWLSLIFTQPSEVRSLWLESDQYCSVGMTPSFIVCLAAKGIPQTIRHPICHCSAASLSVTLRDSPRLRCWEASQGARSDVPRVQKNNHTHGSLGFLWLHLPGSSRWLWCQCPCAIFTQNSMRVVYFFRYANPLSVSLSNEDRSPHEI